MSDRVELAKKLIVAMTQDEMAQLQTWAYEVFKASDEQISWNDAVDELMLCLKAAGGKPN